MNSSLSVNNIFNNMLHEYYFTFHLHSFMSTTALTSSSSEGSSDGVEGRAGLKEAGITQWEKKQKIYSQHKTYNKVERCYLI